MGASLAHPDQRLCRQPAGVGVVGMLFDEGRFGLGAAGLGEGAARAEAAASGEMRGVGGLTFEPEIIGDFAAADLRNGR